MAYEFKLPDLGEGLTEGEIARWLVSEGQEVAEVVSGLYERHVGSIEQVGGINSEEFQQMNRVLQRLDRFWNDTIAYRM